MRRGAIILCGGRSSRMGIDKASLPFGKGTMLERVAATVGAVIAPRQIVVVAAAKQELSIRDVTVVRDSHEFPGPLAAIANGVQSLANRVDAVFITGCDTPLLKAPVINFLFDRLVDFDCVVPQDAKRLYPLCAVYKSSIFAKLHALKGRSLHDLISTLNSISIPRDELRAVDPGLDSFRNINTRDDYLAALVTAGFSTP